MTSSSELEDVVEVSMLAGKLKRLKRAGWVKKAKIEDCESVADHTFRVALMASLLAKRRGLDVGRATTMALLHDLPEAVIGDITPEEKFDKRTMEDGAFRAASRTLKKDLKEWITGLWLDYRKGESEEARLVRDLDKLEMAIQALEYSREGRKGMLEFVKSAIGEIEDEEMLEVCMKIRKLLLVE